MKKPFTPEENLILQLMETPVSSVKKNEIKTQINLIKDWKKITSVAVKNGIAPLFFKNIQDLELKDFVPSDVFQKFKNLYIKTYFKNSIKIKEFKQIINELNNHKIDFIPLKGIYFITELYGDLGMRTMCDIDFMVRAEDVEKCKELLLKLDWKIKTIYHTENIKDLDLFYTPYVFTKDDIMIELHNKLYEIGVDFDVQVENLWSKSITKTYLNSSSKQLNLEDLLIHQILHLYKHFIQGQPTLKSFVDITTLFRKEQKEFNQAHFLELINQYNCKKEIDLINKILKTFFSIDLYSSIANVNDINRFDGNFIFRCLINNEPNEAQLYIDKNKISYLSDKKRIQSINGIKDKIIFISSSTFPNKDFMFKRYNLSRNYQLIFYYPYRVLSILKKKNKK